MVVVCGVTVEVTQGQEALGPILCSLLQFIPK